MSTMRTMGWRRRGAAAMLVSMIALTTAATLPEAAPAQEREIEEMDLPRHVAEEVVTFFNDPATIRFNGASSVPEGAVVEGNVGVLGGPFVVAGRVVGDVVVVNGDLRLPDGGRVEGNVTVIGGRLEGDPAGVEGAVAVYAEALLYRRRGGRISVRDTESAPGLRWGRAEITIRSAGSYNRTEGLPVFFGPTFRTAGSHPFTFEAWGLWRTESGLALDEDELGYSVRAEQRVGAYPRISLGASAYSVFDPIADWGLSSLETSLATFLLHRDYRDYYEREGWSAWASIGDPRSGFSFRLEFRDEDHAFAPVSSPWTLSRNDDPWRPQPAVAEGDLRTLTGELVYDDRNDPDDPTDGWFGRLRLTRGLEGELATPEIFRESPSEVFEPVPVDATFTAGLLDLRRYNRVTPNADLSFRFLYGGSFDGSPVPSQFQQAIGGEGSLPGYGLFHGDCGARNERFVIERVAFDDDADPQQEVFPRYGCDRALLFQLEYRSTFDISLDLGPDEEDEWDEDWDWYPVVDLTPSWAFFFNAGRGWSEVDSSLDTGTLADVGLGVFLGDIGLYWAYPLEGEDRGVNFFVRLEHRF
jgi:hypothetical protein